MRNIQRISATDARNNFFNLLKKSYLEKKTFLIEKGEIPMVYMTPVDFPVLRQKAVSKQEKQRELLKEIRKFKSSMKMTSDSVKLIREMRRHGR